jgi:hypothetical protein
MSVLTKICSHKPVYMAVFFIFIATGHRIEVLKIETLVAEAIDAYKNGERADDEVISLFFIPKEDR